MTPYNFTIPVTSEDFKRNYFIMLDYGMKVLKRDFTPDKDQGKTLIGAIANEVLQFNLENEYIARDLSLLQLYYLFRELEVIENSNPRLFKEFANSLLTDQDIGNFYGLKAEIVNASNLVLMGVKFLRGKHPLPDFVVDFEGGRLGIEVTSTHVNKSVPEDLTTKIWNALQGKEGKGYADNNTVLIIDFTNLIHVSKLNPKFLVGEDLKSSIKPFIHPEKFGSVILTFASYDTNSFRYVTRFLTRIDMEVISDPLQKFLDMYFPINPTSFKDNIHPQML